MYIVVHKYTHNKKIYIGVHNHIHTVVVQNTYYQNYISSISPDKKYKKVKR